MRRIAMGVAVAMFVAGCGSGKVSTAPAPSSSSSTTTSTSTTTTTTTIATTTIATTTSSTSTTGPPATSPPAAEPAASPEPPAAPYEASVATVTAADLGASWHEGCPVDPSELRMLTVTFVGFDGGEHTGRVVVNADVADDVVEVFRRLHAAAFPIRKLKPIFTQAEYDDFETPDDNSTGYSCRNAVNDSGTASWSLHAYGHAIDINPIENPYVQGDRVTPAAGAEYTDRSDVRPGMAVPGSAIVNAFRAVGWGWGASFKDYQHFSTTGQ
ncbi:MAG: hypothetical protein QOH64_1178 [Acidimicrobiaceae bacterium]